MKRDGKGSLPRMIFAGAGMKHFYGTERRPVQNSTGEHGTKCGTLF